MALCDQTDVEQRIQTTFTNNPEPVITALITAAQARMESFVARPLESATYTGEVYDPPREGFPLRLRHWPVTAITAVTVDGTGLTVVDDVAWYENGLVYRVSDGLPARWGTWKRQSVLVTYTGGYLSPDHDIQLELFRDICAWMVARAFETGRAIAEEAGALAGVASEEIGDYSISYATAEGIDLTEHLSLSDEFRTDLAKYRDLTVA